MHLALYQPQVPGNTGTIGRLCIGLDADLHLIGPWAFDLSEKAVRRAGLDYWPLVRLTLHSSPEEFLAWLGDRSPWLTTKAGKLRHDQPAYRRDDVLLFGNEQRGLPDDWTARWRERTVAIPIIGPIRSYNLACAASVVAIQAHLAAGAFDRIDTPVAGDPAPA